MPYLIEDAPEIVLASGRKWRGAGSKFAIDRDGGSYLSYLFKDENRDKGDYHRVFCFVSAGKSIFLNVSSSFIGGDWRKRSFFIFGFTSMAFLDMEFRRIGGYPSIYPAQSALSDNERTSLLLMAMRALIDYGQVVNSPEDRAQGATTYVGQNVERTGSIPDTYLSCEEIEEITRSIY
ncbi:hypothetical protein [Zavarzinia compransoris]|uniref:hypothetical protein n=1 Tax=Zavarzinia compransoris TaxID=1264899 RepID=UPI001060F595|nr:hypothetical protein [Zavarzinia compransoris]